MFSNTRSKSLHFPNNNNFVGPGSYDIGNVNKSWHNDWDKSSRFLITEKKTTIPGPGYYKSCTF
jgi:hypothetical protein